MRYSSVVVMALTNCSDPVQRPSRSQQNSGRTVRLHGPCRAQCNGNCAAVHKARGLPGTATSSVPISYSNAAVTRSRLHSAMLSEKRRHNLSEVLDGGGP